jgi:hypothetical protein
METMTYSESNIIEAYSTVFDGLSYPVKIELIERLLKSFKERNVLSPLDIEGINTSVTTQEIINIIKEGREIL